MSKDTEDSDIWNKGIVHISSSNYDIKSTTDGILMPKALTAENGAKGLLSGEFFEETIYCCPDCDGGEYQELETDRCGTCDDTGEMVEKVTVSWTTIKEIYAMCVEHLQIKEVT